MNLSPEDLKRLDGEEFHVYLLMVKRHHGDEIRNNAIHVIDGFWLYEGETEILQSEFDIVAEGRMPALGGLTQEQLIQLCDERMGYGL